MELLDAPMSGDHRRIREARRKALARAREIDAARHEALMKEFRAELAVAVRSASPMLIAMLAIEGLTLDGAVSMLEPGYGWPERPRLSSLRKARPVHTNLARYYFASRPSQFSSRPPTQISQYPLIARMFERTGGGYLQLHVVDHSLEVEARIGPALIETRFGELSVALDFAMPATVFAACVGRLLRRSSITRHGAGGAGRLRRSRRMTTVRGVRG